MNLALLVGGLRMQIDDLQTRAARADALKPLKNGDGKPLGDLQRRILECLAEAEKPMNSPAICDALGAELTHVCKSLTALFQRGHVTRNGTRKKYTWSLPTPGSA